MGLNYNSTRYETLKALAQMNGPTTAKELCRELDDDMVPASGDITGRLGDLYADHYVDRRKRDQKYKPYEYWVAAKGAEELKRNDDYPKAADGETARAPSPVAVQEVAESGSYLGTDLSNIEDEEVNDVLVGICDSVMDLRKEMDALKESAVREEELRGLQSALDAGLAEIGGRVGDVAGAVQRVEREAVAAADGDGRQPIHSFDGPLARPRAMLHQLEGEGYGVYSFGTERKRGGDVVQVNLMLKPVERVADRGPSEADPDPEHRLANAEPAHTNDEEVDDE